MLHFLRHLNSFFFHPIYFCMSDIFVGLNIQLEKCDLPLYYYAAAFAFFSTLSLNLSFRLFHPWPYFPSYLIFLALCDPYLLCYFLCFLSLVMSFGLLSAHRQVFLVRVLVSVSFAVCFVSYCLPKGIYWR